MAAILEIASFERNSKLAPLDNRSQWTHSVNWLDSKSVHLMDGGNWFLLILFPLNPEKRLKYELDPNYGTSHHWLGHFTREIHSPRCDSSSTTGLESLFGCGYHSFSVCIPHHPVILFTGNLLFEFWVIILFRWRADNHQPGRWKTRSRCGALVEKRLFYCGKTLEFFT